MNYRGYEERFVPQNTVQPRQKQKNKKKYKRNGCHTPLEPGFLPKQRHTCRSERLKDII